MEDKVKVLKLLSIVIIIIIIVIFSIFLFNKKKIKDLDGGFNEEEIGIDKSLKIKEVESPTMYYTVENIIKNYIKENENKVKQMKTVQMHVLKGDQFQVYRIHIQVKTNTGEEKDEFYIVTLDEYNTTYLIEQLENCKDINEIKLKMPNQKEIENNGTNVYSYVRTKEF